MLTLLSECHFWTFREELRIKSSDFGAFRYVRQRELLQTQMLADASAAAKRDYTEKRNSIAVLKNSKKGTQKRLKDNLKKLEELLKLHKVVHIEWRDAQQLLLLFGNGIIVHICVDTYTGDISRMVYEKYLVGKLAAETITDAFFTRSHIVLAYNTNQLTVVHLQKPSQRPQRTEKLSNMDPRIFHVIIPGPAERKLARHLTVNNSYDLFVVWTQSSQNEVYPWRPTIREADRANIHIFKLKDTQLESIAYCWTVCNPLCVDFLRSSESQILTVEEKISRKGEISAEVCSYEINTGKMQRSSLTSIPMGTQICCFAFSPDQEKLFMGAIDRKIFLHDLAQQTTKFVTEIDIIPTHCTWHSDSSIIMIANDRSQFQCFDLALTPIGNQLQSEDVTPSNLLDLSHYFTIQPTLLNIAYSRKPELGNATQKYAQTDCFLLLLHEHGPIGLLRFFAGAGMRGDIHNSGLTADVIVDKYLTLNQLEKAVNLLQALSWETYGAMCLISLHKIANYVFYRSELRQMRIELLARALKTFTEALSEETKDEFSDQVFDLKRRFFFFLLRKNLYAEAFEIALDIDDYDLFMDLYNITKSNVDFIEFSAAAFSQAAAILHEEERANGTNLSLIGDFRSESACSQLSTSTDTATTLQQRAKQLQQQQLNKNPLKNYVPPLPSFKSKVFNAEMIKINIPKPELRIGCQEQRNRLPPPPPPAPATTQFAIETTTSFSVSEYNEVTKVTPTSNGASTILTAASVVSTLAALSSKSGGNDAAKVLVQQQNMLDTTDTAANSPKPPNALQSLQAILPPLAIPDQTIGIPTMPSITATTSQNLRTVPMTTSAFYAPSNTIRQPLLKAVPSPVQIPLVHYATPAVIAEHLRQTPATQRSLQNPAQTTLPSFAYQPKFYQHPLVSGTIPPTSAIFLNKKPTASILSNTTTAAHMNGGAGGGGGNGNKATAANEANQTLNANKEQTGNANKSNSSGEKNKVKFSDTVQVAVVPDIQRKEKPLPPKRNGYARPTQRNQFMNPKKELADSLPLCHPNDDYLKDFNPLSAETPPRPATHSLKSLNGRDERKSNTKSTASPSIKVVHFGVV